ncbi:hypothetical protein PORCAN_1302 [Porphyromonas crevioricanis JCM 13913]|nr:hypothetical protein PORCAN_1302 [Porphyromonas crevioricanis JCM 13913]
MGIVLNVLLSVFEMSYVLKYAFSLFLDCLKINIRCKLRQKGQ